VKAVFDQNSLLLVVTWFFGAILAIYLVAKKRKKTSWGETIQSSS
jgi:nitrogen fixation protein FixH